MPKEQELIDKGIDIAQMFKMQQKTIEEFSLYLIAINKQIEIVQAENEELKLLLQKK